MQWPSNEKTIKMRSPELPPQAKVTKRLFFERFEMAKTILVIDDSASLRQVVKMALAGAGYSVIEAGDGQAALALLDGRQVNMAVCDVNMPIMNGIEFVKAAKALPAYKFMPVLMLTTESQEEKKEQGKAAGAKAWMVKPFSPTQLVNAVSKLCA
jgi:two-component system, chemotaxis family, chemotaxis protein CheY